MAPSSVRSAMPFRLPWLVRRVCAGYIGAARQMACLARHVRGDNPDRRECRRGNFYRHVLDCWVGYQELLRDETAQQGAVQRGFDLAEAIMRPLGDYEHWMAIWKMANDVSLWRHALARLATHT